MAQDAELKLKVSLDLAFFRQQLSTIGTQLGGQSVPIAIKFDKKAIADQYRLLDRYIRGKKFTVELNLVGGLTKNEFDKIKGRLDDLRDLRKVEIPIGIKNGATGKDVDKVVASIKERLAKNQQIKQGGGKLRIETGVKPSITNQDIADFKKAVKDKLSKIGALEIPTKLDVPKVEDLLKALQKNINRQKPLLAKTSIKPSILNADVKAFKNAVESKLSGITVKINAELETIGGGKTKAQIEKEVLAGLERIQQMGAARMGGGVTEPARRESLRQSLQGRDIGELKDIGRQLGVTGVGRFRNAQNLIEKIVTESSIEMITKYLDPQAVMRNPDRSGLNKVLDTFARGLFNMLGMDVASMRQQAAQRRALPGVNFPATVPSRPVSIGPSGTGRALPPGAIPGALPGTAFGAQKYLPTALSDEMKQILRGAAFAFVDAIRTQVRSVRIGIGASTQGMLPPSRVAGLLPAGVGREPSRYAIGGESREQMMARRTAEAYARSALRGMDVIGGGAGRTPSPYSYAYRSARPTSAIVPYAAGGAMVPTGAAVGGGGMVPPGGGRGGGGGIGGFGGFGRALGGVNLPGAGTIRELGGEFAFATKQVLLFGQAYKLLGFAQDFPAQVSAAVSQLQSFRNTLLSVTGSAGAAADANEFILAAVEKYSIPLQSARDGFTKLFASMEPAGFAAGEIQNLFLGISKAAATYGMSADKVDRVNYAFAQMASKGQVMSEELKGQLGDVLPGAMGIFAKAAGFEGPDAIQKFGKALEDGEYKGGKMRELLRNVANEMNKEFGPGAEGAARTFQGAINRMQTATAKLYESFEPAAIGVMNAAMVPFVQTLKNATDGINAYFSGQEAATPAAQGFTDILKTLVPTLTGIGENLKYVFGQVAVLIQGFGAFVLQVGRLLALPIVRYLAGTYVQTLLLTTAFKALATSGIGAALVAIAQFIARGVVYAQVTLGMRVATQQTTVAMYQFGTAVQTVMIKSVIGIALVAISAFIARIVELRGQLAAISGDAKSMEDLAKSSAKLGDVGATKEAVGNIKDRLETYKQLKEEIQAAKKAEGLRGEGATAGMTQDIKLTTKLGNKLVELGLINKRVLQTSSNGYKANELALDGVLTKVNENISSFEKAGQKGSQYIDQAIKQNKKLQEQGTVGVETPDEKSQKAAEKAAEEARKLADDKRQYEADLMNISFDQAINLSDMEFEHWKNLQQAKYDFLEAGQNEWMSRELKFQRDLQAIEIRRIETIRKAQVDTAKAEMKAATSAYVAGDSGAGGGAAMFGATGRVFNAPGWVHGHFQNMNREALVQDTVEVVMKLLQQGVKPELGSGQKFTAGMQQAQVEQLVRRGIASHKAYASGVGAIDVFVPQGTRVPVGLSGVNDLGGNAGVTGNLPRGTQLMHLDPSSRSGATSSAAPASRVRAEAKKDYASALASQEAINAKERENTQIKYANIQAQQELNILIREYTASIVPVEQQRLENTLLQDRIDLISSGVFGEALETEQKISEARNRAALGVRMANEKIAENNKLVEDGILKQAEADKLNASQVEKIKQLTQGLEAYIPLLRERLALEQSSAEATLKGDIARATPLGGMGLSAGFIGEAGAKYEEAIGRGATKEEAAKYADLQNKLTLLEERNNAVKQSILGIGNAFGEAMTTGVAGLIAGTATADEVFKSFLASVLDALAQAASQMIATYIAIGIAKMFAGLSGGGNPAGSGGGISDSLPGLRQYSMEGPLTGMTGIANGGFLSGGFQAFANGGMVAGPTLGLIGEGGEPEFVIPSSKMEGAMKRYNNGARGAGVIPSGRDSASPMDPGGMIAMGPIDVRYTVERINSVDYVTADQFQAGMSRAAQQGALQGEQRTLRKLRNSQTVRSRMGI